MKDKSIYKNERGTYPKPGISADEAWSKMHGMLLEHDLSITAEKKKRRLLIWFCLFLILMLAGFVGYISIAKNTLSLKENKSISNKTKKNVDSDQSTSQSIIQNNSLNSVTKNKPIVIKIDTMVNTANQGLSYTNALRNFHKEPGNKILLKSKPDKDLISINDNVSLTKESNKERLLNKSSLQPVQDTNFIALNRSDKKKDSTPKQDSLNHSVNKKQASKSKIVSSKLHFGLQWNINASLKNNNNYFHSYYSNSDQYYMWLLPSAWASFQPGNKNTISLTVNPYKQYFAGSKIIHIEKPFIANVEPDIVTHLIKTRGIDISLNYGYSLTNKFSISAGGSYTLLQNALYLNQSVEGFSGNILSQEITGVRKKDETFNYIQPSFLSFNASLQYKFRKFTIGAGITAPFKNVSTDPLYKVKSLNGEFNFQYRLK